MVIVDVHEAEKHLFQLLERVSQGERIVICKDGQPVADLVPHRRTRVILGGLKGRFVYDDETFDEPDPDILRMFYGDDDLATP